MAGIFPTEQGREASPRDLGLAWSVQHLPKRKSQKTDDQLVLATYNQNSDNQSIDQSID